MLKCTTVNLSLLRLKKYTDGKILIWYNIPEPSYSIPKLNAAGEYNDHDEPFDYVAESWGYGIPSPVKPLTQLSGGNLLYKNTYFSIVPYKYEFLRYEDPDHPSDTRKIYFIQKLFFDYNPKQGIYWYDDSKYVLNKQTISLTPSDVVKSYDIGNLISQGGIVTDISFSMSKPNTTNYNGYDTLTISYLKKI